MPEARCTVCSKRYYYRNTKGSKLSNATCGCGGNYESVGGRHYLSGENPIDPNDTHTSEYYKGPVYMVEKNKKGQAFYYHNGLYVEIKNGVAAEGWSEIFYRELKEETDVPLKEAETNYFDNHIEKVFTWKNFKVTRREYTTKENNWMGWSFKERGYIPEDIQNILEEKYKATYATKT